MNEAGTNRSSGASLALVVLAIGLTAGYGAFAKHRLPELEERPLIDPQTDVFDLRVLDKGLGDPPVPGAPPSVRWLKLEMYVNGRAINYRPIQFQKSAQDEKGRRMLAEQRWSGGYLYVCIRRGYREATGSVRLNISYRNRPIGNFRFDPLPPAVRILTPQRLPAWPGLSVKVFPVRGKGIAPDELAARVDAPLRSNEALVVERVGSSFQDPEPYRLAEVAKTSLGVRPRPIRLNLGYPEATDAVSFLIRKYRARRVTRRVFIPLRYMGDTDFSRYYSNQYSSTEISPGVSLRFARFDRGYRSDRNGRNPMGLILVSVAQLQKCDVRLIWPKTLFEAPLTLVNNIRTMVPHPQIAESNPTGHAEPKIGEDVRIELAVDAWVYEMVKEERVVASVPNDRRRIEAIDARSFPFIAEG